MTDVTDATFERDVVERSAQVPVVVDLWAEWCGPCRTLGPILERVVATTGGKVELAKVDVDRNPRISASFAVQSIPAVFALRDRKVVDSFIGAVPEATVADFVGRLATPSEIDRLVAVGDEASLRQALEIEPDNPAAVVALADLAVDGGRPGDALDLLARVPETSEVRRVAARARLAAQAHDGDGPAGDGPAGDDGQADVEARLGHLLDRVKADEVARQESSTSSRCWGPTTHEPRAFARPSPPGSSEVERHADHWVWVGGPVPPGADAITVGNVISVRRAAAADAHLMRHEREHVRQWRKLGVARFLVEYLGAYTRGRLAGYSHRSAYRLIPLEVEAEQAAVDADSQDLPLAPGPAKS